ncbi:hypothetical protein PR048_020863 [Dryococelus australis]|uniref:Uncharacterized protein n=1 Tax=Dryococelus australis TaxID=614101 RepID=A0ABQ9GWK2_9NEOP|nr:hypothetical protein PR048_020863 [Dryococelus australis]
MQPYSYNAHCVNFDFFQRLCICRVNPCLTVQTYKRSCCLSSIVQITPKNCPFKVGTSSKAEVRDSIMCSLFL